MTQSARSIIDKIVRQSPSQISTPSASISRRGALMLYPQTKPDRTHAARKAARRKIHDFREADLYFPSPKPLPRRLYRAGSSDTSRSCLFNHDKTFPRRDVFAPFGENRLGEPIVRRYPVRDNQIDAEFRIAIDISARFFRYVNGDAKRSCEGFARLRLQRPTGVFFPLSQPLRGDAATSGDLDVSVVRRRRQRKRDAQSLRHQVNAPSLSDLFGRSLSASRALGAARPNA